MAKSSEVFILEIIYLEDIDLTMLIYLVDVLTIANKSEIIDKIKIIRGLNNTEIQDLLQFINILDGFSIGLHNKYYFYKLFLVLKIFKIDSLKLISILDLIWMINNIKTELEMIKISNNLGLINKLGVFKTIKILEIRELIGFLEKVEPENINNIMYRYKNTGKINLDNLEHLDIITDNQKP